MQEFMREMSQMDEKMESLVSMGFAEGEARMWYVSALKLEQM